MVESQDVDSAVEAHLEALVRALPMTAGDRGAVVARSGLRRRRQVRQRVVLAAAGIAVLAAVTASFGLFDGDSRTGVDTADTPDIERDGGEGRSDGVAGEPRPVTASPFENTMLSVVAPVTAFDANWGVSFDVGSGGGEPVELVLSHDGVEWFNADGPSVDGFAGLAGRQDLLAVARTEGDRLIVSTTVDGQRWDEATLPAPPLAQLVGIAASPTHLLAVVDVPGGEEVEWQERRAQAEQRLEDRFGPEAEYGMQTGPEGVTYILSRDGEVIFDGTAEELDLSVDLIDALFNGPPSWGGEQRLYVSSDGNEWRQGEPPPATGNGPVAVSGIGLVRATTDGFVYTTDGSAWSTVSAPGIASSNRVTVAEVDGFVVVSTETAVYRADTLAGPFRAVHDVGDTGAFVSVAVSWRGVVVVETTVEDSSDGIDSAAEAESLGLDPDSFEGPKFSIRVLTSPDGASFDALEIDSAANQPLMLHGVAPDGWIVVRIRETGPDSMDMGNGYKIDPGR